MEINREDTRMDNEAPGGQNQKQVIIIADYREKTWHDHVVEDPNKNRLPEKILLKMELKRENRFMDMIDLLNDPGENEPVLNPGRMFISRDDTVTLNGIYLADYLSRHGYGVELVKNFVTGREVLAQRLKEEPLAVIISTTFFTLAVLKEVVIYTRKHLTGRTRIIIGGPTVYYADRYYPEILKMYGPVLADTFLVVEKQGEKSLERLLDRLAAGGSETGIPPLHNLHNVIQIDGKGRFIAAPAREENNDINQHIIDWGHIPGDFLAAVVPFQTSLGCPFRCEFCTFWALHPKPGYKTMENIAAELKAIDSRKTIKYLMVIDDTLNISEERIKSFCRVFIDNNLTIPWTAFLRSKPMTGEIAGLLAAANCRFVHIGFESFDNQILQNMNKKETAEDHLRCIHLLKQAGIDVIGSFIFGFPGETETTIRHTVSMINRSGIDVSEIYGFIYFPYSPVSRKQEKFHLEGAIYDWSHDTMDSTRLYETYIPEVVSRLDSFGVLDWDNWGTAALLSAHGFTISRIKEMFKIKHHLIKQQTNVT